MPVKEQLSYLKSWRKKHPHYGRDWMRRNRGAGLEGRGVCLRGTRRILGIIVTLDYFRALPGKGTP